MELSNEKETLATLAKNFVDTFQMVHRPFVPLSAENINSAVVLSKYQYFEPAQTFLREGSEEATLEYCLAYLFGWKDAKGATFRRFPENIKKFSFGQKQELLLETLRYYDMQEQDIGFKRFAMHSKGIQPMESFMESHPFSILEAKTLREKLTNGEISEEEFAEEADQMMLDYLALPATLNVAINSVETYLNLLIQRNLSHLLFLGVSSSSDNLIFGPAFRGGNSVLEYMGFTVQNVPVVENGVNTIKVRLSLVK